MKRFVGSCATLALVLGLSAPGLANDAAVIDGLTPTLDDVVAAPQDLDTIGDATPGPGTALIDGWIADLEAELDRVQAEMQQPRTTVPAGATLREGTAGPRVDALGRRLAELGYLTEDLPTPVFDEIVHAAVEQFQADTGLHVDGLVGPQTVAELNRSLEDTRRALLWTIDQMEVLRADAPDDMMLINVPSSRTLVVEDGDVVMDLTSAVGRYTRQTPLLQNDRITNVTLNPRWAVPPTIMREDVLPLLRSEGRTGVYDSRVFVGGQEVDPTVHDWSEVQPWEIFIRQSPGNHSALGRYLFALTNDQNIFIHDTNHHGVFDRANRWVSSGCIRVEDARDLALYLVRRAGYSDEELDRRLNSGVTQVMALPEEFQLPVYVTYWTATPNGERIVYHRDIYNHAVNFRPVSPLASGDTAVRGDGS